MVGGPAAVLGRAERAGGCGEDWGPSGSSFSGGDGSQIACSDLGRLERVRSMVCKPFQAP